VFHRVILHHHIKWSQTWFHFIFWFCYSLYSSWCKYMILNYTFNCFQASSNLSGYVPACAYSANQYGVYGGPAGNYGHWQSQGASLSHPNSGAMIQSPNLHCAIAFKNPARDGKSKATCPVIHDDLCTQTRSHFFRGCVRLWICNKHHNETLTESLQ